MEFIDLVSEDDDDVEVVHECPVCLNYIPERNQRFYFMCLHMFCHPCSEQMARGSIAHCPLCREQMAPQIVLRLAPQGPAQGPHHAAAIPVYIEDNPDLDEFDSYFSSDDSSIAYTTDSDNE